MRRFPFLLAFLMLAGCAPEAPPPAEPSAEVLPAPDDRPVIVAFGDSLSAGHGVDPDESYPAFLQQELDRRSYSYRVVNAGISGDTTSGGLARIGSILALDPEIVILELGANDGLRGIPVSVTRENLEQMIVMLKQAGVLVVLAGMTLPPNYGPEFIESFERIFTDLAKKHHLPLIPFLLEGVAATRLMQHDGLHPTAEGNLKVAANVLETLEPLLK